MNEISIFEGKESNDVKFALLGNRLGQSEENAKLLFDSLQNETANIFSLSESAINADVEFIGREFDFIYTISKQDIPDNKI
ncbi:MAG: hypothetical protein J6Z11_16640 [Candidatus Riflebacteria bacterium]|nr:hypothetical protein [Candidatus Riflebacteria bacterium]